MSTLTPEQDAAFVLSLPASLEATFLAGCRYQHERTREAAAKRCEAIAQQYDGAYARNPNVAVPQDGCDESAAAIRALTLDEC